VFEEAAAEQDQHQPRPDRGGGDTARDDVTGPPGVVRRTAPARRDEAGSGLHGDGGDSRSGPRACTLDPARRRTRQEERGEREDQKQARRDEADAANESAGATAQPPGAEDRQLRRSGAGEQIAGSDRVLELAGLEPAVPTDTEPAEERDVRRGTTET